MPKPGWLLRELQEAGSCVTRSVETLRDYQKNLLIPFMIENPFSGAFVDMGLGKTVCTLTMLDHLFSRDMIGRALVIAPLRVAVQTWPTEISEWSHTWWMDYTIIRPDERNPVLLRAVRDARRMERSDVFGSPVYAANRAKSYHMALQRKQLARKKTKIHLINREMVTWLVDYWGKSWPYDTVIVDESTSFADHRTKRWKSLNSVRGKISRLHLLSGIPAPEGITDYFAQIYLLDRGERFGRGITAFKEQYTIEDKYSKKIKARIGAEKEIAKKISDICVMMRQEDYLGLEKPLVVERPVVLDADIAKRYKEFERSLVLKLPNGVEIEALNSAALGQKLMQFASGAVYDEDGTVHNVHDFKLQELMQVREEIGNSPRIICYWHKASLQRLRKLLPKAVVMDKKADCLAAWNAGKITDLLLHPASAGHGLNMQLGPGHNMIFFDNPWPLELYLQVIARIARSGQKHSVRVTHLVTRGTLDATVVPRLVSKNDAQDTVRKYIRDIRDGVEWEND